MPLISSSAANLSSEKSSAYHGIPSFTSAALVHNSPSYLSDGATLNNPTFTLATSFTSGLGFVSAGQSTLAPSAEALAKARRKIMEWEKLDGEPECDPPSQVENVTDLGCNDGLSTPLRPVFHRIENMVPPDTPTPSGFTRPSSTRAGTPSFSMETRLKPSNHPSLSKLAWAIPPS